MSFEVFGFLRIEFFSPESDRIRGDSLLLVFKGLGMGKYEFVVESRVFGDVFDIKETAMSA
jgi:hypothetical protein